MDTNNAAIEPANVCCDACAETREMVKDIHAAFGSLSAFLPALMGNPMVKAMTRQFGIDPDAISAQLKG